MKNYDAVIIGAGISGAITASILAKKGLTVLILDSGDEFHSRNFHLDRFYRGDRDTRSFAGSVYTNSPYARFPSLMPDDDYIIQDGPPHEQFKTEYVRNVGGTTLYWLGTALRMHPHDAKINSLYGVGRDWPFTYAELEPWYCRAEKELGVAGDHHANPEIPRSQDYPMPALPMSYLGKRIKETSEGAVFDGKKILVTATPQARNSVNGYQNRPACEGFHNCIPLCPIQAKYDATVHLKQAQQYDAEVQAQSVVYEIAADNTGAITHVSYKRWDGSDHRVSGKLYILAAHGIESPKLLLNSRSDRFPNGIANSSDQVGRNLMDHPSQMSYALAINPVYSNRSPFSTSAIESVVDGAFRKHRAAFRVQITDTGWGWPTNSPYSLADNLIEQGYYGASLRDKIQHQTIRELSINSLTEMLPNPANRVTLTDKLDVLGIPHPRIQFKLDDYTLAAFERSRAINKLIFDNLGVTEQHHLSDKEWVGSGHILGTTIMGNDARNSVVDSTMRSHDHPNLYIIGSSVFPSSFTSNPTLTIAALVLRTAELIAKTLV